MEKIFLFTLTFTLMISVASAEEFLTTKCSTLIQNDLTNSIQVVDIDGDGVPNILFATGVMGNLHNYVYKDVDCTQEWNNLKNGWTFATPGDVKSFVVTDLDKDGRTDIIVNSIDSSRNKGTPKEYVYVITDKGLVNWNFNKECGLSASVGAGDLDGSGIQNVVLGTKNSKVCALADTVKQKDPVLWSFSTKYPVNHVVVDDFTGDGKMEVLAYAGKYLMGEIYLIDNKGELIWNKEIAGGTFIGVNPSNVIQVAKMGDIGLSTIIGTYEDGLKVFDSKGALSWSYKTDKLISSVEVSDLDNDGKNEVIFGSSPDVTVLDNLGQKIWTYSTKEDKTIYSISTSDINGDGIKEVAVGTTRLIYILSDGKLMGEWKYTVEIQGLTKAYEERDADAVAIKLSDLDKDGRVELVAAWNWEQSTIRGNQYSTNWRVYEINLDAKNELPTTTVQVTTTMPEDNKMTTTSMPTKTTTTVDEYEPLEYQDLGDDDESSGICCLPFLPAVLALTVTLLAKIPLAVKLE